MMDISIPGDVFMALASHLKANHIKDEMGVVMGEFVLEMIARKDAPTQPAFIPGGIKNAAPWPVAAFFRRPEKYHPCPSKG